MAGVCTVTPGSVALRTATPSTMLPCNAIPERRRDTLRNIYVPFGTTQSIVGIVQSQLASPQRQNPLVPQLLCQLPTC